MCNVSKCSVSEMMVSRDSCITHQMFFFLSSSGLDEKNLVCETCHHILYSAALKVLTLAALSY